MDIYGAVVLMKDKNNECLSIDVLYMEPWQEKGGAVPLWKHSLYYDFHKNYRKLSETFHCFEGDDCLFGLNFLDAKDAQNFQSAILKCSMKDCAKGKEKAGKSLKSLLGFGSSSGGAIGTRNNNSKKLTVADMSDPSDFQHLIHIGFNPVTGAFEPHNVPPEWAEFFEKAGLTKKDLQEKQTATYVAKFVQDNVIDARPSDHNSNQNANAPPVPPPPPSRSEMDQPEERSQNIPEVPTERANLMDSIRKSGVQTLRPVSREPSKANPKQSTPAGSDLMASMLAQALAERNQKVVTGN